MELNKTPKPKGFNKNKIISLFVIGIATIFIVIVYLITGDPVANRNEVVTQNYAKNDFTSDANDIIGNNNKFNNSLPAANKYVVSQPRVDRHDNHINQQLVQELKAAMKAPLNSNLISAQNSGSSSIHDSQNLASIHEQDSTLPKDDQSLTAEKRNFVKTNSTVSENILSTIVNKPIAPLVLSMGTKIPALLDQEINSELPGQIYAHVSRDVFDSRTHSNLLIPAGSNLVGVYDSSLAYGQERLLVAWKRVNFPNGQWLDIQGMGGADPVGAGFGDQVDNHYWRIFGTTFLISVLAAGAQLSQPQQSNALQSPGIGQTIGQSVGSQIASTGTTLLQKNINIQPTLHIRAGFEFTVEVNKDIAFPWSYTGNDKKLND